MSNIIIEVEIIKANKTLDDDYIAYYPSINILIHNRTGKAVTIEQLYLSSNGTTDVQLDLKSITITNNVYILKDFIVMSFASEEMDTDAIYAIKGKIKGKQELIQSNHFSVAIV